MALNKNGLESGLLAVFTANTPNVTTLAGLWGDAMQTFFVGVVPASATVTAGVTAFKTTLVGSLTGGPAAVDAALTTLVTTIAGGMAGFASVPPQLPVLIPNMATVGDLDNHATAAATWANIFNAWAKTGTAAPLPAGAPVPWS